MKWHERAYASDAVVKAAPAWVCDADRDGQCCMQLGTPARNYECHVA